MLPMFFNYVGLMFELRYITHIGTNIFSASRFKNFEPGSTMFGKADTPEEAGKIFKENAPTSAKSAATIILKNIRKKN